MTHAANRVAIYCRLSEEDRFKTNANDDSNSIVNQKAMLTQYCQDHNWNLYQIYSDDDFTGSDRNRPAFKQLLADAESKKFDIVLCKTQSRFTREIELVEKYINYLFPLWGVRFVSIVDNADTSVKGNKKARQINGLINEWYLEDMSENIKAVLTSRRKEGRFIGAFAPYGYKKDPELKGHLIIDEEAAEVVRQIFRLYLEGLGRTAIARELNREKIPTPTDYKLANGERYKNNHTATHAHIWRYFMVTTILTNEVYIGNLVQNKAHSVSYKSKIVKPTDKSEWIRVENTHEPIIDMDTWNAAQQILADKIKPDFHICTQNIFSRKVFCSECGKAVRVSKGSVKDSSRRYLRCSTRYYAPEECQGVSINYDKLSTMVLQQFKQLINDLVDEEKLSSEVALHNSTRDALSSWKFKEQNASNNINRINKCIKNLYVDKINETIDEDTYKELSKSFTQEKKEYEQLLLEAQQHILELEEATKQAKSNLDIIKQYADCDELSFEIVQLFIDHIVVQPKPKFSRQDNIEIYWKL